MRKMAWMGLAILAGCSDGSTQNVAAPAAEQLHAGQWEIASEVLSMKSADKGVPAIKLAAGSKSTTTSCIAKDEVARPQASLFAGDGKTCSYDRFYMTDGDLSAATTCRQKNLDGTINSSIQGSFTADTFTATVTTATYLTGSGDVQMTTKLSGRRIGECPAGEAAGPAATAPSKG